MSSAQGCGAEGKGLAGRARGAGSDGRAGEVSCPFVCLVVCFFLVLSRCFVAVLALGLFALALAGPLTFPLGFPW